MATKEVRARLTLDNRPWARSLSKSDRQLQGFKRNAKLALGAVAVASTAAALAVGKIGAGFEQSQANIKAVTSATVADMKKIEAQARSLGATTSFSATQASDAMFNLALQGFSVEKSIGASEAVLKFAGATMSDLAASAELVGFQMNNFAEQGATASQVANVLFAATTKGALNFERLEASMADAAPVAGQFGISIEETAAALALFSRRGVVGQKAGVGLRNIILELTVNAQKYKDVLPGGLQATEGLADAIDKLRRSGVPATELMERMGKRGGPLLGLLLNEGSEALAKLTDEITGTNAAFEAYDVTQDTTIGAVNRLKSVMEELALRVFDLGEDKLRGILEGAAAAVTKNLDNLERQAGVAIETITNLGLAVKDTAGWLWEMRGAIAAASTAFITYTALVTLASAAVKTWGVIVAVATGAVAPWLLAVSLVAGAIAGLIVHLGGWDAAMIRTSGEIDKLGSYLSAFGEDAQLVGKTAASAFGALVTTLVRTGYAVKDVLAGIGGFIVKSFTGIWDALRGRISFGDILDEASAEFGKFADDAKRRFEYLGEELWKPIGDNYAKESERIYAENDRRLDKIERDTLTKIAGLTPPPVKIPFAPPALPDDGLPPVQGPEFRPYIAPGAIADATKDALESDGAAIADAYRKRAKDISEEVLAARVLIPLAPEIPVDFIGPEYRPFRPEVERDAQETLDVMDEFGTNLDSAFQSSWDSIIDTNRTGTEKIKDGVESLGRSVFSTVGRMTKTWLTSEKVRTASTVKGESARTAASNTSTAARVANAIASAAAYLVEKAAAVGAAAASFFKAHAWIPFAGIGIALAAIATMRATMGKFEKGGVVKGEPVPGLERGEVPIIAHEDEFVVRAGPSKRFRSFLEDLNEGRVTGLNRGPGGTVVATPAAVDPFPMKFRNGGAVAMRTLADLPSFQSGYAPQGGTSSYIATGGGGERRVVVHAPIIVESGSLLVVEDEGSWQRVATKLHETIEDVVKPRYRQRGLV